MSALFSSIQESSDRSQPTLQGRPTKRSARGHRPEHHHQGHRTARPLRSSAAPNASERPNCLGLVWEPRNTHQRPPVICRSRQRMQTCAFFFVAPKPPLATNPVPCFYRAPSSSPLLHTHLRTPGGGGSIRLPPCRSRGTPSITAAAPTQLLPLPPQPRAVPSCCAVPTTCRSCSHAIACGVPVIWIVWAKGARGAAAASRQHRRAAGVRGSCRTAGPRAHFDGPHFDSGHTLDAGTLNTVKTPRQ
jgi:hypothetical protein